MHRLIGWVLLAGCVANLPPGDGDTGEGSGFAPETTSFDSACGRCEVLGEGIDDHFGGLQVLRDPAVDDAEAQWVTCLTHVMACAEAGGALAGCVAESPCPPGCRAAFADALGTATDAEAAEAAIDAVFFAEGGACTLPGEAP